MGVVAHKVSIEVKTRPDDQSKTDEGGDIGYCDQKPDRGDPDPGKIVKEQQGDRTQIAGGVSEVN